MKIAFVYDSMYPWGTRPREIRVWEIARRLSDDHDVHMFSSHLWDGPKKMERNGITHHGVCDPIFVDDEGRSSVFQNLYFTAGLIQPLISEDFDIIDFPAWPILPVFIGKLHEAKFDSVSYGTFIESYDDYKNSNTRYPSVFGGLIERVSVRLPTEVITVSNESVDRLMKIGSSWRISVVPYGVDYFGIQKIQPVDRDWDVLYVGELLEDNNIDRLLAAVKLSTDRLGRSISCGIIGDGPHRETLTQLANEMGVVEQVTFLGAIDSDDVVIGHLKAASVLVQTASRKVSPTTILEAGSCDTPSIVMTHEDHRNTSVVEHGETGLIAELSPEAIAVKINQLIQDDEFRALLGKNASRVAKQHDWNEIVARIEDVYQLQLGGADGHPP